MVLAASPARAFESAAAEVTFGLHVADHGLDGGSTSQLAFDGAEDAALLSRDEDAAWTLRIVTTVTLVNIGALDLAAGELLGVLDDIPQGVTVPRVWPSASPRAGSGLPGNALACSTNRPPGARRLVVTMEAFTPNS